MWSCNPNDTLKLSSTIYKELEDFSGKLPQPMLILLSSQRLTKPKGDWSRHRAKTAAFGTCHPAVRFEGCNTEKPRRRNRTDENRATVGPTLTSKGASERHSRPETTSISGSGLNAADPWGRIKIAATVDRHEHAD